MTNFAYLIFQEAFFGRNLMDTSNLEEEMKQISGLDEELDEDVLEMQKVKSAITLSKVRNLFILAFSCNNEFYINLL